MKNKQAIIVFAREPRLGRVKTRLSKDLGVTKTLRAYTAFLSDILRMVRQLKGVDKFIYYHGVGTSIPFLRKYERGFTLRRQLGQDLGARMQRAIAKCLSEGYQKVVIIGTDCVTLKSGDIKTAFASLDQNDVVLGPANDGGYYLMALKAPFNEIFEGIAWSSDQVLKQTTQKIRKARKRIFLLPLREDIDTIEALNTLKHSKLRKTDAPQTFRFLRNL